MLLGILYERHRSSLCLPQPLPQSMPPCTVGITDGSVPPTAFWFHPPSNGRVSPLIPTFPFLQEHSESSRVCCTGCMDMAEIKFALRKRDMSKDERRSSSVNFSRGVSYRPQHMGELTGIMAVRGRYDIYIAFHDTTVVFIQIVLVCC
jgi:hypothetical protein